MDRSTPINLISVTKTQDDRGVWHEDRESRQVFARVRSASATEFFSGGRNGLKPSYVFDLFLPEYSGEPIVEYNSRLYSVYRTYIRTNVDIIELHAEEKGGVADG